MFFRYSQINVGGHYVGAQIVFVEAANAADAEAMALREGVYFDGVVAGRDCECCGDRWTRYADEFPTLEEAIASVGDSRRPEGDSPVYRVVRLTVEE